SYWAYLRASQHGFSKLISRLDWRTRTTDGSLVSFLFLCVLHTNDNLLMLNLLHDVVVGTSSPHQRKSTDQSHISCHLGCPILGTSNYGPGNSSDAGSKGYVPQAGLSGLDSLELSRDECSHRDNHISYFEQTHAILQLSPSISILIRLLLFVDWVE
ncbi:hypothetical protein MJO28_014611, partial [Puccinia striiformis f. sp. tritici]